MQVAPWVKRPTFSFMKASIDRLEQRHIWVEMTNDQMQIQLQLHLSVNNRRPNWQWSCLSTVHWQFLCLFLCFCQLFWNAQIYIGVGLNQVNTWFQEFFCFVFLSWVNDMGKMKSCIFVFITELHFILFFLHFAATSGIKYRLTIIGGYLFFSGLFYWREKKNHKW